MVSFDAAKKRLALTKMCLLLGKVVRKVHKTITQIEVVHIGDCIQNNDGLQRNALHAPCLVICALHNEKHDFFTHFEYFEIKNTLIYFFDMAEVLNN